MTHEFPDRLDVLEQQVRAMVDVKAKPPEQDEKFLPTPTEMGFCGLSDGGALCFRDDWHMDGHVLVIRPRSLRGPIAFAVVQAVAENRYRFDGFDPTEGDPKAFLGKRLATWGDGSVKDALARMTGQILAHRKTRETLRSALSQVVEERKATNVGVSGPVDEIARCLADSPSLRKNVLHFDLERMRFTVRDPIQTVGERNEMQAFLMKLRNAGARIYGEAEAKAADAAAFETATELCQKHIEEVDCLKAEVTRLGEIDTLRSRIVEILEGKLADADDAKDKLQASLSIRQREALRLYEENHALKAEIAALRKAAEPEPKPSDSEVLGRALRW